MKLRCIIPGESISVAVSAIRAHRLRSFLTVLGIVVGVVVVTSVASILTGLRGRFVAMVEDYGVNNIYAYHLSTGPRVGDRDRSEYARKPLTPEDANAIRQQSSAVEAVAKVAFLWQIDSAVKYHGESHREGFLQGVSAEYIDVTNASLQEGRFISEMDDKHRRDVMVLGINVVESLFPDYGGVVGEHVQLSGRTFEIIGVLEKRKNVFFGKHEEDNGIFIPFETGRKLSPMSDELNLHIRAKTGMLVMALDQVKQVLRLRRGVKIDESDNFSLTTADQMIEQFDNITVYAGIFAITVSMVGLLVGGIGVMNIMLVSVTERAGEIGVRKAVGARKRDIMWQFLLEAMTLTFIGGALGLILAVLVSQAIILLIPELPASIPIWAAASGLIVSAGVGLVFGVWPAKVAADLDPIECLRYE